MPNAAERNAGLQRLSMLTRWVAGGAVALTGVFSVMAARATTTKAAPQGHGSAGAPSQVQSPPADQPQPTDNGGLSQDPTATSVQPTPLAPPPTAPRSSQSAPVVVSGGS